MDAAQALAQEPRRKGAAIAAPAAANWLQNPTAENEPPPTREEQERAEWQRLMIWVESIWDECQAENAAREKAKQAQA